MRKDSSLIHAAVARIREAVICVLLLSIATSAAAAERAGEPAPSQTLRDEAGREIVFRLHQHSLAHGLFDFPVPSWPIYIVTVYRDGTVVFEGQHRVRTMGRAVHTLTESQYKRFNQKLTKLDFPSPVPRAGVYFARIEALRNGSIHRSTVTFDDVKTYVELRKSLEEFLRTMEYRCPVNVSGMSKDDPVFYVCADIFELNGLFRERNNGQVR